MNDEELEQRLAALHPAPVPEALQANLIAAEPRPKIHWLRPLAGALAAAAAVAIWLNYEHPTTAPTPAPEPSDFRVFVPIAQDSTLLSFEEIGVIEPAPDQPVRLMRATWLDDITYRGDDGRSTFRQQQPRAEIIPILLHTL